jgi:hypothetical protein
MAKRNRWWSKKKSASHQADRSKTRRLLLELLEPRKLLSGAPSVTLAGLIARMTPDPHPSGDQPADISQEVPLANYTSGFVPPDPGIDPAITQFVLAVQQIYAGIEANTDARPGFWGEDVATGAHEYRLHLDDNGMLVTQWTVDWGDGTDPETDAPQPWVVHQYPTSGQYTIEVTATSPDGTFSSAASQTINSVVIGGSGDGSGLQVQMSGLPPTLHVADTQTVAQGQTFALDNLASFSYPDAADASPTSFTYSIDWGDGSAPLTGNHVDMIAQGNTNADTPFLGVLASDAGDGPLAHVYSDTGTYYVGVTVTASGGLSDAQTIPINVVAIAPVITGLPDNKTCSEGNTLNLSAGVNPSSADPVAYQWQIVDSSGDTLLQTTDPSVSYTFTGPDTYTVSLVATLDGVQTAPATAAITVNNIAPSFASSNPIPDVNASVGQTFTLPPVAFTDPGTSDTHTATINWNDGTTDDATVTEESADGSTPGTITGSHAYAAVGTGVYTATIRLTDDSGASISKNFNVNVAAAAVALNSFTPSSDGSQLQVSYTVSGGTAAPFNIDIYTSPDGTTPDQLLMLVAVDGSTDLPLTTGTHTASFPAAFDDVASDYHLIAVTDASTDPTQNTVEFAGGIFVAASVQTPTDNYVYVFGAPGVEKVSISSTLVDLSNSTSAWSLDPRSISGLVGIHVRGEDGDEVLHVDTDVTAPLWLYGGATTEILDGASGENVINGNVGWTTPQIVDDSAGDASGSSYTYAEHVPSGDPGWSYGPTGLGFNGTQRVHDSPSGSTATAAWTFANLDPSGYYDIYVTWAPTSGAAMCAPYSVSVDGGTTWSSQPTVNQQQAPTDYQMAGVFWHDLGIFHATAGTLIVQLGTDSTDDSGEVLADSAMIVPQATAPLTDLAMNTSGFNVDANGNLSVTYTVNGEDSLPFSIGIYGSPDGVQPTTLMQTDEVDDPTLLAGGGQSHTVTFPASLDAIDSSEYVVAQLDSNDAVEETSKADNISAPLSGIFEQDDGTLLVLGNATSLTGDNIALTQDLVTGNVTVGITGEDPTSSESFAGVSAVTISTPGGNNTIDIDPSMTAPVSLFAGAGSSVTSTSASTTVTDLPQINVVADVPTVSESSQTAAEFTLTRTVESDAYLAYPLTVDYSVDAASTAVPGNDYTPLSGSVTFAPGSATAIIPVTPLDAGTFGASVTVMIDLTSDGHYTIDSDYQSATVTIDDDLPAVSLVATNPNATESGSAGMFTVSLANRVTLSNDLLVPYTLGTQNGDAVNGDDYQMLPGDVIIPAGQNSATIPISPIDTGKVGGSQAVVLTLGAGSGYDLNESQSSATVTIDDNDLPVLSVYTLAPFASAGCYGRFELCRNNSSGELPVEFGVSGTAGYGDYVIQTTVEFQDGFDDVIVPVEGIQNPSTPETVVYTLLSPTGCGYTVSTAAPSATVVLADPSTSAPEAVSIFPSAPSASKATGTPGQVTIALSHAATSDMTFDLGVSGTAVEGNSAGTTGDYAAINSSVTISAGQTQEQVAVTPSTDHTWSGQRTMTLSASLEGGFSSGSSTTVYDNPVTVTIADDTPEVTVGDAMAVEGDSEQLTVTLSHSVSYDFSVPYSTSDDTAMAPTDYTSESGALNFAAGTTVQTITVPTLLDGTESADTYFSITVGDPATGKAEIEMPTGSLQPYSSPGKSCSSPQNISLYQTVPLGVTPGKKGSQGHYELTYGPNISVSAPNGGSRVNSGTEVTQAGECNVKGISPTGGTPANVTLSYVVGSESVPVATVQYNVTWTLAFTNLQAYGSEKEPLAVAITPKTNEEAPKVVQMTTTPAPPDDAIRFSITGGNVDGLFVIDSKTGIITLVPGKDLTNASQDVYKLVIQAVDAGWGSVAPQTATTDVYIGLTQSVGVTGQTCGIEGTDTNPVVTFVRYVRKANVDNRADVNVKFSIAWQVARGDKSAVAASAADFQTSPDVQRFLRGQVTIPAGQNSVSLTLPLNPKHASQEIKTFNVTVESYDHSGYTPAAPYTPVPPPGASARTSAASCWFYILDGVTAFARGGNDPGADAVSYQDVHQGGLGDCFFCAALAAAVRANPSIIRNIISDPDGTQSQVPGNAPSNVSFTVKLWKAGAQRNRNVIANLAQGVNSMQPTGDVNGKGQAEIWPWLIEAAYMMNSGRQNYGSIDTWGGTMDAWYAITGGDCTGYSTSGANDSANLRVIISALREGKQVILRTSGTLPAGCRLCGHHAYLVTGNPDSGTLALYNPWGGEDGPVTMNTTDFAAQVTTIFVCSLPGQ